MDGAVRLTGLPSQSPAVDVEVVRWAEVVRRSGSVARARTALRHGRWRRVLKDAYVEAGVPDVEARVAAVRLGLPADVAVSHRTALWLLGVGVDDPDVHVTVPRGRHLEPRPGLRPHTALLSDEDLVDVRGLLVVSAARAVVDVARAERLVESVAVADAVLRSGAATLDQIDDVVDRSAGLRGVRRARQVLPFVEPRSESLMESRLRMVFVLGGLPRPEAQLDVYDDDGHVARLDLHLDGVAVEYDGREQRLLKEAFVLDRRRQGRVADLGLEVRRFTSADVYQRPAAAVCGDLLRAVAVAASRDRSRVRTGPDTLRPPRLRPLPTRADLAARHRAA